MNVKAGCRAVMRLCCFALPWKRGEAAADRPLPHSHSHAVTVSLGQSALCDAFMLFFYILQLFII